MAEEFVINSNAIETKINQLLPSQGGFQPGVDFSASTMVIPIVDLTETAEGSGLRQDLQLSLSLNSVTSFSVSNTTTTIISNTGYYRVFGAVSGSRAGGGLDAVPFTLTDGTTSKIIVSYDVYDPNVTIGFDFNVLLQAGQSLKVQTTSANQKAIGCTRQIADLTGNLVNPT